MCHVSRVEVNFDSVQPKWSEALIDLYLPQTIASRNQKARFAARGLQNRICSAADCPNSEEFCDFRWCKIGTTRLSQLENIISLHFPRPVTPIQLESANSIVTLVKHRCHLFHGYRTCFVL